MRKLAFTLISILVILPVSYTAFAQREKTEPIDWHKDFKSAIALAKETGRPTLIEFGAIWCGPCKAMEKEVWPEPRIVSLSKKFICIYIDVDKDDEVTSHYVIEPIPTIIFADSWGNEITRHVGYMEAEEMAQIMKNFPSDFFEINEWNAVLEKDRKNGAALMHIGHFYRKCTAYEVSNQFFEKALKTKEVRSNNDLSEELIIAIGFNYFNMDQFKDARRTFEYCLSEYPDGSQCDKASLGIIMAQLKMGKISDAEKTFKKLQIKYPDSSSTHRAAEIIQKAKENNQ